MSNNDTSGFDRRDVLKQIVTVAGETTPLSSNMLGLDHGRRDSHRGDAGHPGVGAGRSAGGGAPSRVSVARS